MIMIDKRAFIGIDKRVEPLTYFCKKGRHSDCPGEWPMGEPCVGIDDCSFDVIIKRCTCECHQSR
jgi:hypothetical protein